MSSDNLLEIEMVVDTSALQSGFQNAVAITDTTTERMATSFNGAFRNIDRTFRTSVNGVLQGTQTMGQAFSRLGTSMVSNFLGSLERMVTQFSASQIKMVAFHQAAKDEEVAIDNVADTQQRSIGLTGTLQDVTQSAVKAAGRAYAWGAELGGPPLGAAMAAVAFAGVEAFGALASAAGGWDYVPNTSLAILHPQEMVLSAPMASGLRNVISSFPQSAGKSAGAGGGAGFQMGDMHIHVHGASGDGAAIGRQAGDAAVARILRLAKDRGWL